MSLQALLSPNGPDKNSEHLLHERYLVPRAFSAKEDDVGWGCCIDGVSDQFANSGFCSDDDLG